MGKSVESDYIGWFDVSMRKRLAFVVVWDNAGNDFSGSSCFLDR